MDLTKITTVFGELPKDVQDALKALPLEQVQARGHSEWVSDSCPSWYGYYAYRQKPVRSFTEAYLDLPNGTIFQVGNRRYIKYVDRDRDEVLRQLDAPNEYCWYSGSVVGWRCVDDMEGFTPSKLTEDDIIIKYVPEAQGESND